MLARAHKCRRPMAPQGHAAQRRSSEAALTSAGDGGSGGVARVHQRIRLRVRPALPAAPGAAHCRVNRGQKSRLRAGTRGSISGKREQRVSGETGLGRAEAGLGARGRARVDRGRWGERAHRKSRLYWGPRP